MPDHPTPLRDQLMAWIDPPEAIEVESLPYANGPPDRRLSGDVTYIKWRPTWGHELARFLIHPYVQITYKYWVKIYLISFEVIRH